MKQYLLYYLAESEMQSMEKTMTRLEATKIDGPPMTSTWTFAHRLLEGLTLEISLLCDIDGVTPYLRQHPVDLLVYDERGQGQVGAVEGIKKIHKSVNQLASLWGPDFKFPASRIVTILKKTDDLDHLLFELGRLKVRDVLVAPKSTASVLRWLKEILYHGIIRTNTTGIALSGGAIEGFLYQIGVLHALNCALSDRNIQDVDVISGVSSGSIIGAMLATKVPIIDLLRALHGLSSTSPQFKLTTFFDFAGFHIFRRFARMSFAMPRSAPNQWIANILQSIPTGFFKGDKFEKYLREVFKAHNTPTKFVDLDTKFYVGTTDQDNFDHVVLGRAPLDKMDIASAVRASSALPPLFTPKRLQGRNYIDGQVTKSCDLESVIGEGARLVLVVDPLKPYKTTTAGFAEDKGGFFSVVQMIKALVSTRFDETLHAVTERYPDVDFIVFQPSEECAKLMSGSPLKSKLRTEIIESAYRGTLRMLRERHRVYASKLGRHGYTLRPIHQLKILENNYYGILRAPYQGETS